MSCDKYARMIIKMGTGIATVPASSDHRNGDWIATDIYDGELYLDTATGIIYTSVNGVIQIAVYGTSTNFANTNLTFDASRTHDTNGFTMFLSTDAGAFTQASLEMSTTTANLLFGTVGLLVTSTGNYIKGGVKYSVATASANFTLNDDNHVLNCTANTFTVTLPTAGAGRTGKQYIIKNSGTGIITVDPNGAETIDGDATITLNQYESITIISNGTNWMII